jgi:nitrate/nitrite transporter NarK
MWLTAVPNKQDSKQDSTQQQVAGSSSPDELQAAPASSSVNALTLMSKLPTWAIIIVNFVNHWGYFIYLNWMPSYFNKVLGLDLRASSLVSFLPWLVMAAGSSFAGVLADGLVSKGVPVTTVRKALQTVAFLVPAVALLLLANPAIQPGAAVACMTVALGTTSLGQAGFVANMSDIAPKHAGKMFGLCNTFGSLAGILGVVAVGYIYEATGSFNLVFQATAAMYLAATIAWNLLATGEKVFD